MKNLKRFSKLPVVIFVLLLGLSCSDHEPAPKVEELIEGGFTGGWKSTTSTGASFSLAVSSVLEDNNGSFYGPFFISNKFKPKYGQFDDGSISFNIRNDSIFNFNYTDTIPGCEGSFSGSGIVDSDGKYSITFTGFDCDGFHNGTLFLERAQ